MKTDGLFARLLVAALADALGRPRPERRALRRRIGAAAEAVRTADAVDLPDAAARDHHVMSCLVLAADQVLSEDGVPEAARRGAIGDALIRPGGAIGRGLTRLMLLLARDPMTTLVRYARRRVPPRYGRTFAFEEEGGPERRYVMRVTRCFYHAFFTRHGAPELTRLFCAVDRIWIDTISPARHGVRFERPTTLAEGGSCCRFEFHRAGG